MKFLWLSLFLLTSHVFAQTENLQALSLINSIDDGELPPVSREASPEALPQELYESEDYTIVPQKLVADFFNMFAKDSRARNKIAGGKCAVRRAYIQSYLKRHHIKSGSLYINCPGNRGHMQLIDQVTGHRYNFANFHDVNLLAVPTGYNVMDVQFTDRPMTLSEYLALVEASQKLKPLEERSSSDRGYCYWQIR